jgi:hypothetical protein
MFNLFRTAPATDMTNEHAQRTYLADIAAVLAVVGALTTLYLPILLH